jgi:hypothetical protein
MRGGIAILDEKGENLEVKVVAQTDKLAKILNLTEKQAGIKTSGYRIPVSKVDIYRKLFAECQAQFVPDTSNVAAQVVPTIAQPVMGWLLGILGSPPGIFAPLIRAGKPFGMLNVVSEQLSAEDMPAIQAFANHISVALDNASLVNNLQQAKSELEAAYSATLEGWVRALELRDKETEGHTQRVAELTVKLWRAMKLPEESIAHIRRGALLHDIGKMGIPDHILLKPGVLSSEEWGLMRQHPTFAYEWMRPVAFLTPAQAIPHCHHERYDGSGYPRGLRGEQIPLEARLFAVVDVYDAMRRDRPYRQALSDEQIFAYIREQSGKHFDPFVAEAFLELW